MNDDIRKAMEQASAAFSECVDNEDRMKHAARAGGLAAREALYSFAGLGKPEAWQPNPVISAQLCQQAFAMGWHVGFYTFRTDEDDTIG